jgi:predicted naringenin-chalcone synthase
VVIIDDNDHSPPFSKPPIIFSDQQQNTQGDSWTERRVHFEMVALSAFEKMYLGENLPPDDIIHVSCSGYVSPSPAQRFLSKQNWLQTGVTHSYHMGCYGAFPAIRTATGIMMSSHTILPKVKNRIDIVHTEFLTLHADLHDMSPANLIIRSLFADGFIKYSAYAMAGFDSTKRGLRILAMQESMVEDSLEDMKLTPGAYKFDMTLSREVPAILRRSVSTFVSDLCAQIAIDFENDKERLFYAIHPGGTLILDGISEALGLHPDKLQLSREVLYQHGNMASATVPHIWQFIVESDTVPIGAKVVSLGFGPGLTMIGTLFEKI